MRIVSLVPSLSESLVDLGLRDSLVGCTKFCVEPADLHRTAQTVGGPKDFSLTLIDELRPTHILANQEENPKELMLPLMEKYPVLLTFPKGPADVPQMMSDMQQFLGLSFAAPIEKLQNALGKIQPLVVKKRFLYFIWREPYMIVGRDTYISRCLETFGFENCYLGENRYPVIQQDEMQQLAPDLIFFSTEPYPFRMRDAERLRAAWSGCPDIYKIDGRLMSWYGTMTIEGLRHLQGIVLGTKEFSRL